MGYEKDEMSGHGFRAMASTILHEQGWKSEIIERQLAHTERNSVKAAYNYAQYLPERRKMMQAWADYLVSNHFENILLLGHSLGGIKALYSQAHLPHPNIQKIAAYSATKLS